MKHDQNIFGIREGPMYYEGNTRNVSDENTFTQALDSLLSNLKDQTAAGDSTQKFELL